MCGGVSRIPIHPSQQKTTSLWHHLQSAFHDLGSSFRQDVGIGVGRIVEFRGCVTVCFRAILSEKGRPSQSPQLRDDDRRFVLFR